MLPVLLDGKVMRIAQGWNVMVYFEMILRQNSRPYRRSEYLVTCVFRVGL